MSLARRLAGPYPKVLNFQIVTVIFANAHDAQ